MDRNRFIQCMKSNIELSDKERRRIIRRSVESQPWKLKCTIAMEEFAELTQAISKQIRGYDNRIGLLEEMADAYICLEFLKSIFNITPEMIKLEHVVLASPEQMKFIIEGMRNPMNSWGKSDSEYVTAGYDIVGFDLGESDHSLMQRLSNTGTDHRKFMRMLPVYVRITAPLYWWKEFDTYKVGTVANSCSTMHKIQAKEFTMDDFSCEHIHIRQSTDVLKETIDALNVFRDVYLNGGILSYENGNQRCYGKNDKEIWWQMIQLLPSSYNQTRNVMMNYEVLANIYKSRKDHKLDEWRNFCKWIEELPYSELITGGKR